MWYQRTLEEHHKLREALAESGLPECPWMIEWQTRTESASPAIGLKALAELHEHVQVCPLCQARDKYLFERFGKASAGPRYVRISRKVVLWILRYGRPAQCFVGTLIAFLFLGVCAAIGAAPHAGPVAIAVYFLAILGGAFMAWAMYQVVGLVAWAGLVGRWLARSCAGAAGMLTFVSSFRLSGYASVLSKSGEVSSIRADLTMCAVIGVLYGTLFPVVTRFRKLS